MLTGKLLIQQNCWLDSVCFSTNFFIKLTIFVFLLFVDVVTASSLSSWSTSLSLSVFVTLRRRRHPSFTLGLCQKVVVILQSPLSSTGCSYRQWMTEGEWLNRRIRNVVMKYGKIILGIWKWIWYDVVFLRGWNKMRNVVILVAWVSTMAICVNSPNYSSHWLLRFQGERPVSAGTKFLIEFKWTWFKFHIKIVD